MRVRENSHHGKYCTSKIVLFATAFYLKIQGHDNYRGIFEQEKFQFYSPFLILRMLHHFLMLNNNLIVVKLSVSKDHAPLIKNSYQKYH